MDHEATTASRSGGTPATASGTRSETTSGGSGPSTGSSQRIRASLRGREMAEQEAMLAPGATPPVQLRESEAPATTPAPVNGPPPPGAPAGVVREYENETTRQGLDIRNHENESLSDGNVTTERNRARSTHVGSDGARAIRTETRNVEDAATGESHSETNERELAAGGGEGVRYRTEDASETTDADGTTTETSRERTRGVRDGRLSDAQTTSTSTSNEEAGTSQSTSQTRERTVGPDGAGFRNERTTARQSAPGVGTSTTVANHGDVNLDGENGAQAGGGGSVTNAGNSENGHAESTFSGTAGARYSVRIAAIPNTQPRQYNLIVTVGAQGSVGHSVAMRARTDEERGITDRQPGERRPGDRDTTGTYDHHVNLEGHATTTHTRILTEAEVQPYLDDLRHAESGEPTSHSGGEFVELHGRDAAAMGGAPTVAMPDADAAAHLQNGESITNDTGGGADIGQNAGVRGPNGGVSAGYSFTNSGSFRVTTAGRPDGKVAITLAAAEAQGGGLNAGVSAGDNEVGAGVATRTAATLTMTFVLDESAANYRALYAELMDIDSDTSMQGFARRHADLAEGHAVETEHTDSANIEVGREDVIAVNLDLHNSTTRSFEVAETADGTDAIKINVKSRQTHARGRGAGGGVAGTTVGGASSEEHSRSVDITFRITRAHPQFAALRRQLHAMNYAASLWAFRGRHADLIVSEVRERSDEDETTGQMGAGGLTVAGGHAGSYNEHTQVRNGHLTGNVHAEATDNASVTIAGQEVARAANTGSADLAVTGDGQVEGNVTDTRGEANIVAAIGRLGWDAMAHPGAFFSHLFHEGWRHGATDAIKAAIRQRMVDVVHSLGVSINTHDFEVMNQRASDRVRWESAGIVGGVNGFIEPWRAFRTQLIGASPEATEARIDPTNAGLLAKFRVIGHFVSGHGQSAARAIMEVLRNWGAEQGETHNERLGERFEWPDSMRHQQSRYESTRTAARQLISQYSATNAATLERRYQQTDTHLTELLHQFRVHEADFENETALATMTEGLHELQGDLQRAHAQAAALGSGTGSTAGNAGGQHAAPGNAQAASAGSANQANDATAVRNGMQAELRAAGDTLANFHRREQGLLGRIAAGVRSNDSGEVLAMLQQLVEFYEVNYIPKVLSTRALYRRAGVAESDWKVDPHYHTRREYDPNLRWAHSLADQATHAYRNTVDTRMQRITALIGRLEG